MRKLFHTFLAGAVALLIAGAAQAATFDAANSSLQIILATFPPIIVPGNTGGATSSAGPIVTEFGSPTKAFGPANVDLADSLFTGVPQIVDLRIQGLDKPNGTGNRQLTATGGFGGGFGGVAPLSGSATICAFSCAFGLQIQVPLNAIGGTGAVFYATALGVPLTVTPAAGWTTGAAVITGLPTPTPTAAVTGTYNLTPVSGAGTVTLVTPVRINVGATSQVLPLFGIQTLVFMGGVVPEPGTLLLLGSGIAGLMVVGRQKMRK